jgi:quinol monooxygenase YgiN
MIVVVARVATDAARRDELVRVGNELARASRAEEGCVRYALFQATEDENAFVFVEEWESQEALDTHFGTPHLVQFMQAVPNLLVATPEVKFHTVASTVDLADPGANA